MLLLILLLGCLNLHSFISNSTEHNNGFKDTQCVRWDFRDIWKRCSRKSFKPFIQQKHHITSMMRWNKLIQNTCYMKGVNSRID